MENDATRCELEALEARQLYLGLSLIKKAEKPRDPEDPEPPKWAEELALNSLRIKYLKTGNPLYLWKAYREARRHDDKEGWKVPGWFFKYLDESVEKLAETVDRGANGHREWAYRVAEAFGLDHGSKCSAFKDSTIFDARNGGERPRDQERRRAVQLELDGARERGEALKIKDAIRAASKKTGISESTLKRAYYANRAVILK